MVNDYSTGEFKYWHKIFFIEIGAGLRYPSQEERWAKYGKPLERIFSLFFEPPTLFTWFKDIKSQSTLEGVNVICLESRFKWKESQNDLVDLGLLAILSDKINELFTRLGTSWAFATGVFSHPDPTNKVFATLSQTSIPITLDSLVADYPIFLVLQLEPRINFLYYIGGATFCRRLRQFPDKQVPEIIAKAKDIHILDGFPSMEFGERENPIVNVSSEEISYEQAKSKFTFETTQ
jgi:hypothetical protein